MGWFVAYRPAAVISPSTRAEGTPLSKVLSDTPNGRLADSGVNEKRFCIGFALVWSTCYRKRSRHGYLILLWFVGVLHEQDGG
jgi:hypothetical protein